MRQDVTSQGEGHCQFRGRGSGQSGLCGEDWSLVKLQRRAGIDVKEIVEVSGTRGHSVAGGT